MGHLILLSIRNQGLGQS